MKTLTAIPAGYKQRPFSALTCGAPIRLHRANEPCLDWPI